ncbi:MAG: hypothetical protein HY320_02800 [Armatimonadetes bacterium]|nr:hypothetical protein [Armatimonadota bacterium]
MRRTGSGRTWRAALWIAVAWGCLAAYPASAQTKVIQNGYIKATVQDSDHRWQIVRVEGDPLETRDDSLLITRADFTANKVTLWVESIAEEGGASTGIFGGSGGTVVLPPTVTPDGQSVVSSWRFPEDTENSEGINILVIQRLTLVRDLVRLEYQVLNQGARRVIGLRVAFDPAADSNNLVTNPFLVPEVGLISREREFTRGFIPDQWFAFFPDPSPYSFVQNVLRGLDTTPPDRLVFGGYTPLIGGTGTGVGPLPDWDFTPNPGQSLLLPEAAGGNGSVGLYWLPRNFLSGQRRTFVTYLGAGVADHSRSTDILGSVQALSVLPLTDGRATPDGFRLDTWATNLRSDLSIQDVEAMLELPQLPRVAPLPPVPILELVELPEPQELLVPLGDLDPAGQGVFERTTDWLLRPTGVAYGDQQVSVILSPGPVQVNRNVVIPHEDRVFLQNVYRMITIPYSFVDDTPEVALGLDADSFQAVRWDPEGLMYRELEHVRPGESFWVRLLGATGRVVELQDATPVDIPPGEVFSTSASPGWNQMGNASPWPVNLQDLKVVRQSTGQMVDFDTALRVGWIRSSIWRFDPNQPGLGYIRLSRTARLQPGDGLWFFVNFDLFILWPPPTGPGVTFRPQ